MPVEGVALTRSVHPATQDQATLTHSEGVQKHHDSTHGLHCAAEISALGLDKLPEPRTNFARLRTLCCCLKAS
jgi:hypothetical protein